MSNKDLLGQRVTFNVEGKVVTVSESGDDNRRYVLEINGTSGEKVYVPVSDEDVVEEFIKKKDDKGFVLEDLIKEGDVWYDTMDNQVIIVDEEDIEHAGYSSKLNTVDLVETMLDLDKDILLSRDGQVRMGGVEELAELYGIKIEYSPCQPAYSGDVRVLLLPDDVNQTHLEQAVYLLLGAIRLVYKNML